MTEGRKFDADKLRYDLIPEGAERLIAAAMSFGAILYGEHNWLGLFDESLSHEQIARNRARLYGALRRHLEPLVDSHFTEDAPDASSGLPHLAHALASLSMLAASMPAWDRTTLRDALDRARAERARRDCGQHAREQVADAVARSRDTGRAVRVSAGGDAERHAQMLAELQSAREAAEARGDDGWWTVTVTDGPATWVEEPVAHTIPRDCKK